MTQTTFDTAYVYLACVETSDHSFFQNIHGPAHKWTEHRRIRELGLPRPAVGTAVVDVECNTCDGNVSLLVKSHPKVSRERFTVLAIAVVFAGVGIGGLIMTSQAWSNGRISFRHFALLIAAFYGILGFWDLIRDGERKRAVSVHGQVSGAHGEVHRIVDRVNT